MYKLLITDIDGTLLNDRHEISMGNKKALHHAMENGVQIALCSGRSKISTIKFEQELGIRRNGNYGIGSNGGCIYEAASRRVLREIRLPRSASLKIIECLKRYDAPIIVFGGETEYVEKRFVTSLLIDNYFKITGTKTAWLSNYCDAPEDFLKIIILGGNEYLREIQRELLPVLGGDCNIFFSSKHLLEFTNHKTTKGAAVEYLAEMLEISRDEVITVGDNHNDISMIQWAGLGIAVRNAVPEAKSAAGYVTEADNNSSALAEIVEKFVKNKQSKNR